MHFRVHIASIASKISIKEVRYVIEYDLTDEERALHSQGMAAYKANPDSFIPLDNVH